MFFLESALKENKKDNINNLFGFMDGYIEKTYGTMNDLNEFFSLILHFVTKMSILIPDQCQIMNNWNCLNIILYFILCYVFILMKNYILIKPLRLFRYKSNNSLSIKTNPSFSYIHLKKTIISIILSLMMSYCHKFAEPHQNDFVQIPMSLGVFSPICMNSICIIRGSGTGCESENISQGRSFLNVNILISHCSFSRSLSCSGDGGVILVEGGFFQMNIENVMFYNCFCTSDGGAIYYDSDNSFLKRICVNRCSCGTSNNYHFAYLRASQVNQGDYLSISSCSHTTHGSYSFLLSSGYQRVENSNSSMNCARFISGIGIGSPYLSTSSYCTFSNNKVSHNCCISFYSTFGTITMSYANIIHNNSPLGSGVILYDETESTKMIYCIYHNNQNYLFYGYEGYLEVSHSFIDHLLSSFSGGFYIVSTTNNSFRNENTYQIQFFNSLYCNTDMKLFEKTPVKTVMKSLINTVNETPTTTVIESPVNSMKITPINTTKVTPNYTLKATSKNTVKETQINTVKESPINTLKATPKNTVKETPIKTVKETVKVTHFETLPRTFDEINCSIQMVIKREINIIYSFIHLSYLQL